MTDGGRVEEPGVSLRELADEQPDKDDYTFGAPVCVSDGDRVINTMVEGNPVGTIDRRAIKDRRGRREGTETVIVYDDDAGGYGVCSYHDSWQSPNRVPVWVECGATGRIALIGFDVGMHDVAAMDCPVCGATDSCGDGGTR